MKSASRRYARLGVSAVAVVALLLLVTQARSDKEPERKAAAGKSLKLSGRVEASEQTPMYARIMGYVGKVNVELGDRVKKGQVLAEQSVPEREAEVKQKEAIAAENEGQVQHAQLLLKEAKAALVTVDAQGKQADAGVKVAQAKLDEANAAYKRALKLKEDGVIDAKVVEERANHVELAKANLELAQLAVQTAQANHDASLTSLETSEIGIKTAQAQREATKADAARAAAMLQYAKIAAPFDGVITRRSVDVGKFVGPTGPTPEPLFVVTRIDKVRVVVAVSQEEAAQVRLGGTAVVRVGNQDFSGKIARTAGVFDPAKHTLRVEIDVPNADGHLMPGMAAEVSIATGQE